MQRSSSWRAALAGVAALILATAAHAQADAAKADEGALKYRQSLMAAVGGDMAALSNLMKYGLSVPGAAATHADGLASHAKLVAAAFERKVTEGPTDAEPAIWEKPDEFRQGIEKFQAETAKLATTHMRRDARSDWRNWRRRQRPAASSRRPSMT